MNVVFDMVWTDIVDDKLNVLDVETPSANRRSDKNVPDFLFEILDRELSICLVHASVEHKALIANIKQFFKQVVSVKLFLNEDQDRPFFVPKSQ